MSSKKQGLILYDAHGKDYLYESTHDTLTETFESYEVTNGKWILYEESNFNKASEGHKKYLELSDPTSKKKLPFIPLSIRRLRETSDSVEAFEYYNYGGECKEFLDACGNTKGGFSIIIWPKQSWVLYEETKYQGFKRTFSSGWKPNLEEEGFSNGFKSLTPAK